MGSERFIRDSLLAGIAIGPYTPGLTGDPVIAGQLAEIGVILLMFGVGLHFSMADLLSVRAIAIPGAVAQIAVATILGMGLGWAMGWPPGAGFVFGLALSVASTVVLLRALQDRRLVESERGRIAVGWLIARAWKSPTSTTTGMVIWPTTIVVGMLLRRFAFDDGTALAFIIVATAFTGVFLVGWRALYR